MTKSRRSEGSSWNTSRDVSLFFIVYAAALTESVEMTSDVSATDEFSPDSCWGNKTHHFWHEVSDYRSFWTDFREFLLLDISCSFHFCLTLSLASDYIYLFLWGYKIKLVSFFSSSALPKKTGCQSLLPFIWALCVNSLEETQRKTLQSPRTRTVQLSVSVWRIVPFIWTITYKEKRVNTSFKGLETSWKVGGSDMFEFLPRMTTIITSKCLNIISSVDIQTHISVINDHFFHIFSEIFQMVKFCLTSPQQVTEFSAILIIPLVKNPS